MRHQSIDIETWATAAHFKAKTAENNVVTDCKMPNEKRYMQCPAEKLLGEYRSIQYTPDARTVQVKGMGALMKMDQIRAICAHCIYNKQH